MSVSAVTHPADLSRAARRARWLCLAVAAVVVAAFAVLALDPHLSIEAARRALPAGHPVTPGMAERLVAVAAALAPGVLLIAAMVRLSRMFRRIEAGRVLERANADALAAAGVLFAAFAVAMVLARVVQAAALTWANGPGERALAISFGTPELTAVAAGAVLYALGRVMGEAAAVADENRAFV